MAKVQIKNICSFGKKAKGTKNLKECQQKVFCLENGEKIQRGCGLRGLYKTDVGWRCLYCGNYIYENESRLEALWLHFRVGREYWRVSVSQDRVYINGIPVSGLPDSLPRKLVSDLADPRPPKWFPYFVCYEGRQFQKYLEKYWNV